ncbi:hypothetical protein [Paraburkholderia sp. MM5477-R1]|uniref:hypothetical protein n=1 Tax=Paraburkholderia sp. MM5477-R1 TaxID=2991062 RepID=UPI003D2603E6
MAPQTRKKLAAPPPPEDPEGQNPSGVAQRFIKFVGDSWQLISVLTALSTALVGAFTYFATRQEVTQTECQMSTNLLVNIIPTQVEQLTMEIETATEKKSALLARSSDADKIQNQIDDYKKRKAKLNDEYDAALAKLTSHACFNKEAGKTEKQP